MAARRSEAPETRYARGGDVHIAYQVVGDGPLDLVIVPTWISQVEHLWEDPRVADFLDGLTSFARVMLFDRRGSGLSDPVVAPPTLESQMDDVLAVMDAAGSERAALLAQLEGGPMALMFAATHRDRSASLILYSSWARLTRAPGYPCGNTLDERHELVEGMLHAWGSGRRGPLLVPSLAGDRGFSRWFGRLERLAASPTTARAIMDLIGEYDVREVLETIEVPTLVMNRREDELIDPCHSAYLAREIPGARRIELSGRDTLLPFGEIDPVLEEIEEFLTGSRAARPSGRILATVLFSDIVGSTERAAREGDRRWRELLDRHDRVASHAVQRFRGRKVKSTGDGMLATFDGPARAIRCAQELVREVDGLGIALRVGLHTGEVEVSDDDLAGLAVHIGARVCEAAGPREVLASSTVRDLVVGSEISFADRGVRELRGVPHEWRLYEVVDGAD